MVDSFSVEIDQKIFKLVLQEEISGHVAKSGISKTQITGSTSSDSEEDWAGINSKSEDSIVEFSVRGDSTGSILGDGMVVNVLDRIGSGGGSHSHECINRGKVLHPNF